MDIFHSAVMGDGGASRKNWPTAANPNKCAHIQKRRHLADTDLNTNSPNFSIGSKTLNAISREKVNISGAKRGKGDTTFTSSAQRLPTPQFLFSSLPDFTPSCCGTTS